MSRKEKILVVCVVVVLALSFVFRNSWTCVVYALSKAVAAHLVPLALTKLVAGICGVQLLP